MDRMVLASTSVHGVEQAPKTAATSVCPQCELQLPPASWGTTSSAGASDSGSFQIAASALGPLAGGILCAPFKTGASISHSPLGP